MQTAHDKTPALIHSETLRSHQVLISERQEVIDFVESIHHCFLPDKGVIKAEGLLNILNYVFDYKGGKEYLYVLFPDGLLSTSSGLVDLPNEKIQSRHKSAETARSYNEQQLISA